MDKAEKLKIQKAFSPSEILKDELDIKVSRWMQRALIDLKQKYIDRTTDAMSDKAELEEQLRVLTSVKNNIHNTKDRRDFIKSDLKTIQKDIKKYFDYMGAIQRRIDKLPI